MKRSWSVVALGGCLALLAGCASVPTSGPIRVSDGVAVTDRDSQPVALVSPPADGATPEQVVTGFLTANAVPDDNYAIARTFLSPEVQDSWNPEAGSIIYDDGTEFGLEGVATSRVRLVANEVGRASAQGAYQVSAPNTTLSQEFTLRKISDEWRILVLRDGLLLTERDVARVYDGYDLYFLEPTKSVLVPDRVLVVRDRPGVAATLVRRLLDGPTDWLAPAVSTAFPAGTSLAIDAVPNTDGVVTVDLSEEVLVADDAARRQLAAQLVWTLAALPGVNAVQITVGGQPLALEGIGSVLVRDSFSAFDPDVLADGTVGYLVDDDRLRSVAGEREPVEGAFGEGAIEPAAVAVALTNDGAAVEPTTALLKGQVYTAPFSQGAAPVRRVSLESVSSMSYDLTGTIIVTDGASNTVTAIPPFGGASRVALSADGRVVHAEMSRDGARVALIVRRLDSGSETLYVARVVRNEGTIRFEAPRRVENQLTGVVDVAWSDADRLTVLASVDGSQRQVVDVVVGGTSVVERGGVTQMSAVAAAPGSPVLVQAAGVVWQNAGSGWRRIGAGTDPVYPG